jgi:hypothetical protein
MELGIAIITGAQMNKSGIGLGQQDYAAGGAAAAMAGSDRITHNADTVLGLRHLLPDESQKVLQGLGGIDLDHHDERMHLKFNQVLHVEKNRGGQDYKQGIPFRAHFAISRYQEVAYERGEDGKILNDATGRPAKTQEIEFLHSPQFSRRSKGFGKFKLHLRNVKPEPATTTPEPVTANDQF